MSFVSSADTMCSHKEFIVREKLFMHLMQRKIPRTALGEKHALIYSS